MSAKLERAAAIKAEIRKAIDEIEHGDPTAAIQALTAGLTNMLEMVMEQEELLTVLDNKSRITSGLGRALRK